MTWANVLRKLCRFALPDITQHGCSDMLEELMDDEDEMRDMNLSSRPGREEKRRIRERDRLEREMERCRHKALPTPNSWVLA